MNAPTRLLRIALLALPLAVLATAASGQAARDPMRPPQAVAGARGPATPAGPQLTAIVNGEGGRVAVFNGEFVRGGERVGDCLILAVLADGVRYRRGERVLEVHLASTGPSYMKPAAPLPGPPRGVDP